MLYDFIYKIRGISLKWKLLIPFLFFSLLGTTSLVFIGLSSQHELIKEEEKQELQRFYELFLTMVEKNGEQALSMATIIAQNPRVKELLAAKNRDGLFAYSFPLFEQLEKEFGIRQMHFHVAPGRSFLRVHSPHQFGEMISYRKGIMDSMKGGKGVVGLEWGLTGLGIRGVAPVYLKGALAGTVEIGYPFDVGLLEELREKWGPHFSVYERKRPDYYPVLATTMGSCKLFPLLEKQLDASLIHPVVLIAPPGYPEMAILAGPIKDYGGEVVALVEICTDRSSIVNRLRNTRNLMIIIGFTGICLSFLLTWVVAVLFIRPIKDIVANAGEIAAGKREARLTAQSDDEIGLLTQSLNTMLDSLKERRRQVEHYAKTLEKRVKERTADLVTSEEKYRTLVDNLPLGVYRILCDGTTEFINPYFVEKLGFSTDEVVGYRGFWRSKIWGCDDQEAKEMLHVLIQNPNGIRTEREIWDKKGNRFVFIDHAIPFRDDKGILKWFDGIMVDITEVKRLQEEALRGEEIRVLGEISERFAHEMRNPLATAGGFARRLRDSIKGDDPHGKMAQIILDEVGRLENILNVLLSTIKPFVLHMSEVDPQTVLRTSLEEIREQADSRKIALSASLLENRIPVSGDKDFLKRALVSILRNAVFSMSEGGRLAVSTSLEGDNLVVWLRYPVKGVAEDDVTQFFIPRLTGDPGTNVHDLPLSKVIMHRHGGRIQVKREDGEMVVRIELPVLKITKGDSRERVQGVL